MGTNNNIKANTNKYDKISNSIESISTNEYSM